MSGMSHNPFKNIFFDLVLQYLVFVALRFCIFFILVSIFYEFPSGYFSYDLERLRDVFFSIFNKKFKI